MDAILVLDEDIVIKNELEQKRFFIHNFNATTEPLLDIERRRQVKLLIIDIRIPIRDCCDIASKTRGIVPDVLIVHFTALEIIPIDFENVFPMLQGRNVLLQIHVCISQLIQTVERYLSK